MALAEDAATVLEQFVHDVANLPAEIVHLYEEMQAKQQLIHQSLALINARDSSMQKFIKLNGGLVKNPKEEAYETVIKNHYDRAQLLQEEKIGLAEKAFALLERHVKRLDIKMRDLQNDGSMPLDPSLPSLLRESSGNLVPPLSNSNTGVSTPLHPLSLNVTTGGAANIANAAIARLTSGNRAASAGTLGMQPHPLLNHSTPAGSARQREQSVASDSANKRRRLNMSLGNLPATSSNLARQSSLGPGTPKASTPGSRQGSAGPAARPRKAGKRVAPHEKASAAADATRKKVSKHSISKRSRRRILNSSKASPTPTTTTAGDEDSLISETAGTDDEDANVSAADGVEGDEGEEESDDTKYCFCQSVSYGDMVACDNDDCEYQWFHWGCVGIQSEPMGDWLCPACRKLPRSQIKKSK